MHNMHWNKIEFDLIFIFLCWHWWYKREEHPYLKSILIQNMKFVGTKHGIDIGEMLKLSNGIIDFYL